MNWQRRGVLRGHMTTSVCIPKHRIIFQNIYTTRGKRVDGHYRQVMVNMGPGPGDTQASRYSQPAKVVEDAVTLFRKNDMVGLKSLVDVSEDVDVSSVFDVGSRRLLPSNLLRRSLVLSVLPVSNDSYQIRMNISSKSGEQGVLVWRVGNVSEEKGWLIERVWREQEHDQENVPVTLHPRYSPESIIRAYIDSMGRRDYIHAHGFCHGVPYDELLDVLDGLGYQKERMLNSFLFCTDPVAREALEEFLMSESFGCIIYHKEFVFGHASLVDQRHMVQEVVLKDDRDGDWKHVMFHISIQHHGCWAIHSIEI